MQTAALVRMTESGDQTRPLIWQRPVKATQCPSQTQLHMGMSLGAGFEQDHGVTAYRQTPACPALHSVLQAQLKIVRRAAHARLHTDFNPQTR